MATGRRCIPWPSNVIIWVSTRCRTRSWRDTSMTNTPPGSSTRATPAKHRACRSWLSSPNSELNTRYTRPDRPLAGTWAMSPAVTGIESPPGLAQPLGHRGRGVYPLAGSPNPAISVTKATPASDEHGINKRERAPAADMSRFTATVYRGLDILLDLEVAVKQLTSAAVGTGGSVSRLRSALL